MTTSNGNGFIEAHDIYRQFVLGDTVVRVLRGVDLHVGRGELLCLMGPSGSGKTTLLNALGGLDPPDEGQIVIDGEDITQLDENGLATYRCKKVGYIFQTFNLIQSMTALQNVEFPMIFAGVPRTGEAPGARPAAADIGRAGRSDGPQAHRAIGGAAATCGSCPRAGQRTDASTWR
jgi:putative ABC transport system ATP-binding protein